jgi:hypothetical protein
VAGYIGADLRITPQHYILRLLVVERARGDLATAGLLGVRSCCVPVWHFGLGAERNERYDELRRMVKSFDNGSAALELQRVALADDVEWERAERARCVNGTAAGVHEAQHSLRGFNFSAARASPTVLRAPVPATVGEGLELWRFRARDCGSNANCG